MGEALDHDSRGRTLSAWQGCRVVADDEVFLMNWQSEDSFRRPLLCTATCQHHRRLGRSSLNTLYMAATFGGGAVALFAGAFAWSSGGWHDVSALACFSLLQVL